MSQEPLDDLNDAGPENQEPSASPDAAKAAEPVSAEALPTAQEAPVVNEGIETYIPPQKPIYTEPGFLLAMLLILAALALIVFWAVSGKPAAPAPTPTAELTLGSPAIQYATPMQPFEPTETPLPTETPIPTPETRADVIRYTIQDGDTIYSIAEKFNLDPNTILWSNRYQLGEDLTYYTTGTELYILPVDGVYHMWQAGEGLNGVASAYNVSPDDIIDYPLNKLDRARLGDLGNPNIPVGTMLIVPDGTRSEGLEGEYIQTRAARKMLDSLPVGMPEQYPSPRSEIIAYQVKEADSIFSIAEAFGIKPETILWANRYLIGDTPDGIYPGQKLIILPVDGVYHAWARGEGLNGVSRFYNVEPASILEYPLNHLSLALVGDLANPNIKPGTMLVVPGGTRPAAIWAMTVSPGNDGVGEHPNVSYLGTHACNSTAWAVGTGNWAYPTTEHWLSGYDYTPPTHSGVDWAGRMGYSIFAADSGVVIYSGWSNRGYGNTIVIDHGNGYLTLYSHMMDNSMVPCGIAVTAGQLIASMGSTGQSTGPHLHFEVMYNGGHLDPHKLYVIETR